MGLDGTTLEDMCELVVDCPHSTPTWTNEGIIVLRNQYIRDGILDLSDPSYTNEEDYQKRIKRAVPQAGDIVFTREAPMGEVCLIPEGLKCCLGQRQVLLRPKSTICGEYLFWALQSPYVQHQISWNEGTGTTVSNVRIPVLKALKIPRRYEAEEDISRILTILAQKISTNGNINHCLESMAQALFKSWFVDFDPVIDNALAKGNPIPEELQKKAAIRKAIREDATQSKLPEHIQKLFPNEFELSEEMGWVPKGWKSGTFADIAEHIRNGVKVEAIGDDQFYVGLEHIGRKQLFLADSGLGADVDSNKSGFVKQDLLFGKLRPYFHKVCIAPDDGICSTDILVFRARKPIFQAYMYLCAYEDSFVEYANMRSTGTRMPRANAKDMLAYSIAIPGDQVLECFQNKIESGVAKGMHNIQESSQLDKLRKILLPKLISGEIELSDSANTKEIA